MRLRMKSWSKGVQTVSLIQLVKQYSTGSLIQAKVEVERFLAGTSITVKFASKEAMEEFKAKAIACGVIFDCE